MRQATLNANFGRAEVPGFYCFLRDLLRFQEIGVGFAGTTAESAKLATYETDVSEIYISIYNICDDISRQFAAKRIRSDQHSKEVVSIRIS
jgi:hypothetical protein